jgi:predicted XRE-type DNA-binding protein
VPVAIFLISGESLVLTGAQLGAALKEAMTRKGVTQNDVAAEFGVAQSSVSEWIKYGRIAKKHLNHLVVYFAAEVGPQHWGLQQAMRDGANPAPQVGGVAHNLSLMPFTLPVQLTWEQVMQSQELPERFIVESPDDALSPRLPRGTAVVFERASAAQPGECVLVRDKRGATHMRRYVQGISAAFTAQALNDAYASLDSERDGLVVLAVMAWRAERRV